MKSTRPEQTRRTFFAAIGAAVLGKYAVKFWPELADPQFLSAEPPLVFGSALPTPNTGLFGLQYYQVDGNWGNYMGIPRAMLGVAGGPKTASALHNDIVRDWQRLIDDELLRMRKPGSFHRYMEAERYISREAA